MLTPELEGAGVSVLPSRAGRPVMAALSGLSGLSALAALSVLAALAALSALPLSAQAPRITWPRFVAQFDSVARADGVVGGSVRLLDHGKVTDHQFGVADRERGLAESADVIQHWASITKMLTAIAVLQLRDQGLLSLDDPVVKWVPELRAVTSVAGNVDAVTLRMLLTHTSGFQAGTWPWRRYETWEPFEPTRWEQLVAMMPYMRLRFEPGSRFSYSNPGYIYLAQVIERISGDPWEAYVHKNIFQPLALDRSSFRRTPWSLDSLRSGNYTLRRDSQTGRDTAMANAREFDPGVTVPNSGWNAPISDLTRLAQALLRPQDSTLLRRSRLAEMWEPAVDVPSGEYNGGESTSMGLGFFIFRVGSSTVVGHTGIQAGFRSFLFLDPATARGIIGVWNTENAAAPDESESRWESVQAAARGLVAGGR